MMRRLLLISSWGGRVSVLRLLGVLGVLRCLMGYRCG